jgi:hypothetical protein
VQRYIIPRSEPISGETELRRKHRRLHYISVHCGVRYSDVPRMTDSSIAYVYITAHFVNNSAMGQLIGQHPLKHIESASMVVPTQSLSSAPKHTHIVTPSKVAHLFPHNESKDIKVGSRFLMTSDWYLNDNHIDMYKGNIKQLSTRTDHIEIKAVFDADGDSRAYTLKLYPELHALDQKGQMLPNGSSSSSSSSNNDNNFMSRWTVVP